MKIEKKILPEYFKQIKSGKKKFENFLSFGFWAEGLGVNARNSKLFVEYYNSFK